jgi:photosystem II stability/assembly factor-like uncharacterized protein
MKKISLLICFTLISACSYSQWTLLDPGVNDSYSSMSFINSDTGYVCDFVGIILKTTDGGATWKSDTIFCDSYSGNFLSNSVFFTTANIGYACGSCDSFGKIFKTIDGGINWTQQWSDLNTTYHSLYAITFTDLNTGYAVGDHEFILKTTDGGITWSVSYNGATWNSLTSVFFVDADTGYAAGMLGTLLKTMDGGVTWTYLNPNILANLYSVFFTDANTGYIVGEGGLILKTLDGGAVWRQQLSNSYKTFNSVFFTSTNTGYITGGEASERSVILKTINAGSTWTIISDNQTRGLKSVCFPGTKTGYAAGYMNALLKTTDGGIPFMLDVSPSKKLVSSNAGTTYFIVTSDTCWAVTCDSSWCRVTPSGSGTDTIFVSYLENISASSRVDTIHVGLPQQPTFQSVTIMQGSNTGIENLSQKTFQIYPNPANSEVIIINKKNLQEETLITIFNMIGELKIHDKFQYQNLFAIDVSSLPKGTYLLKIQSAAEQETNKLVIQ